MGNVTLNGQNIGQYGIVLLTGSYAELLTPPKMKKWISNDIPNQDGTQYLPPASPTMEERNVTLHFLITAATREDITSNYNWFINEITSGLCTFYFEDLDKGYTLKYESCTSYDMYSLKECKLAIKFVEPSPTKNW